MKLFTSPKYTRVKTMNICTLMSYKQTTMHKQTQTTEYEQVYCQKYLIYTDTDLDECRAMAARVKTMHDIIHTNKQQQHTNKQTTKS